MTEPLLERKATVALVHGLWMRGWCMAVLARRLRAQGFEVRVFSYSTRAAGLDAHADALHAWLADIGTGQLHLVGHSMGGLVILNLLKRYDDLPPGRVVLMGSPVGGSRAVARLQRLPGHERLFGKARQALLQGYRHTPEARETGMIHGTRALGLGRVTGRMGEPSDGTVAVSETKLDGLEDRAGVAVSHTGLLFSAKVAAQTGHFLAQGKFLVDA